MVLALVCFACASNPIVMISLNSSPSGAKVTVNDEFRAYTPVLMSLHKKSDYEVLLTMNGYEEYAFSIKHGKNYSGWIISNILGGLVGMTIAGGFYDLSTNVVLQGGISSGLYGMTIDAATGKYNGLYTTDETSHVKGKPIMNVKLKPIIIENK